MPPITRLFLLISLFILISGCGGGGENQLPSKPEVIPDSVITGIAMLGPIVDADISIYSYIKGERAIAPLASTKSDNKGEFEIVINIVSMPLIICATNGSYVEEASSNGTIVSLNNDELCSVVNFNKGQNQFVTISFYTNAAYGLVENKLQKNTKVELAIKEANLTFSDWLGLDIVKVKPVLISDPINKPEIISNSISDNLRYGFANAAISQLMKWVSSKTAEVEFSSNTSMLFAKRTFDDIEAIDGYLDGQSNNGQLAIGLEPISADLYRNKLAVSILLIAASSSNQTSLSVDNVFSFAELINNYSGSLFLNVNSIKLSKGKPEILVSIPNPGDTLIGTNSRITANVADITEIGSVTVELFDQNNNKINLFSTIDLSPNNINNIDLEFDSTKIQDGNFKLLISATNVLNITTVMPSIDVTISNTSMTAVIDQNFGLVPLNGSSITINAAITDTIPLKSAQFKLNGNTILTLDKPIDINLTKNNISATFDSNILNDGAHFIELKAISSLLNRAIGSDKVTFNIDNTNPKAKITGIPNNFVYSLDQNTQVNFVIDDPSQIGSSYSSGIKASEFSLGGTLVNSQIHDQNSLSFNPFERINGVRKFSDGWMLMSILAIDNANNSNISDNAKDIIVGVDSTPPTQILSATSIKSNTWVNRIYIEGSANDNPGTGISKTEIFLDGSSTPTKFDNSNNVLSLPISDRKLTQDFIASNLISQDGLHNVRIITTDFANNVTETNIQNIGIDTVLPRTGAGSLFNTVSVDVTKLTVDCEINISSYDDEKVAGTASGLYKQEIRVADSQDNMQQPIVTVLSSPTDVTSLTVARTKNLVTVSDAIFPEFYDTPVYTYRRFEVKVTDRTGVESGITRNTQMTGVNTTVASSCLIVEVTSSFQQIQCIQAPCPPGITKIDAVCSFKPLTPTGLCGL